jgi:predicted MFS family arabinose efflux permease
VRAPVGLVAALLVVRLADESLGFLREGAFESWRSDLGLSYREAAAVLVAAAPGSIVGSLFSALADYRSRRLIASGGAFGFAVSLLAFAVGHSFATLASASFVLGTAATAMVHACEVALIDLAGEHLERAIGSASLFGAAGDLLGPLVLIITASLGWSWRVPFFVGAALCAGYGVWLAMLPLPRPAHVEGGHRGALRNTLALLRDPAIWRFGLVAVLFVQLDEAYLAFVIAYLRRDQHLAPGPATLTASAIVIGTILGFTAAARSARRASTRGALRGAAALLAVSSIGIALLRGPLPVAVCGLVFGIAGARFWVVFHATVLRHRPGRAGSVTAVVGNLEMLGFAFPVAIGAVADTHGLRVGLVCYAAIPVALLLVAGFVASPGYRSSEGAKGAPSSASRKRLRSMPPP